MPRRPWLLTEQVQGPIWLVPSFERAIVSSHNTAGHAAGTRGALFCLQAHAHTIPSAGCTSPSASSGKVNVCTEAISWICLLSLRGIEAAITTGPLRPHSPGLLQSARASPGCPVPYGVALSAPQARSLGLWLVVALRRDVFPPRALQLIVQHLAPHRPEHSSPSCISVSSSCSGFPSCLRPDPAPP